MTVPLIGQPATILKWYGTVILQCHCRPDRLTLIIVTGTGNAAVCGHCGKLFMIKGYTIEQGAAVPVIDIALPTPTKEIM